MIGNDIVDLVLASKESNWKRKGFLEKIFSTKEQELIQNALNPELMVWNLWSRKEASYKIYNRQTGIKGYFPWLLECQFDNIYSGTVTIDDFIFYTKTEITNTYIYTIAVLETAIFAEIKSLKTRENILKNNGIPYIIDNSTNIILPVSITHHGQFQRMIYINQESKS